MLHVANVGTIACRFGGESLPYALHLGFHQFYAVLHLAVVAQPVVVAFGQADLRAAGPLRRWVGDQLLYLRCFTITGSISSRSQF